MFFPCQCETRQPSSEPPDWIEEMRERYHQTGEVRPEDVARLLGDPSKAVYMRMEDEVAGGQPHHPLFDV